MPKNTHHLNKNRLVDVLCIFGFPIAICFVGWFVSPEKPAIAWGITLAALIACVMLIGRRITGDFKGCLIDSRFMCSLSRFQMLSWTILVLSSYLYAVIVNIRFDHADPLAVAVPTELWLLMGISTVSLVGSPLILSSKKVKSPDEGQREKTVNLRHQQLNPVFNEGSKAQKEIGMEEYSEGLVFRNTEPGDARLTDIVKGEEIGNAATVDLPKLQMFFFTTILLFVYGVGLARTFSDGGIVTELPAISETVLALLGISHTGYLAGKGLPHSKEAPSS